MGIKRAREAFEGQRVAEKKTKRQKKGFSVGPDNLPEGEWKRKTQQIKRNLIEKAKIKKDYAKIKSRQATEPRPVGTVPDDEAAEPATTEINPERQVMIAETPEEQQKPTPRTEPGTRHKKSKPVPFAREHQQALWAKTEAEERRKARDEAEAQRQQKLEERERFRRAMAKARTGGKNGQRKLGRESKVLLEKVQRIVNES